MSASLREKFQRFGLQVSLCCHGNGVTQWIVGGISLLCLLVQEFVDASRQTKWCPHTACGKVVSYISKGGGASERSGLNVECEDGHTFCW